MICYLHTEWERMSPIKPYMFSNPTSLGTSSFHRRLRLHRLLLRLPPRQVLHQSVLRRAPHQPRLPHRQPRHLLFLHGGYAFSKHVENNFSALALPSNIISCTKTEIDSTTLEQQQTVHCHGTHGYRLHLMLCELSSCFWELRSV